MAWAISLFHRTTDGNSDYRKAYVMTLTAFCWRFFLWHYLDQQI